MTLPIGHSCLALLFATTLANAGTLSIDNASDWGGGHGSYPASNAIDGSTDWSSRWAASPQPANLELDLGAVKSISSVGIAWGRGDERTHTFEIRTRADNSVSTWDKVYSGTSSGSTDGFETYDFSRIDAQWVRIKVFSNSAGTEWTNITEVEIYDDSSSSGGHDLDASKAPSGNFDLLDWYLSIPIDEGDGYASSVKENALAASYEDEFFYTGSDGGMVFYTPVKGVTTSSGTKYVRTELREMLRRGDTSNSTSGKANNWAFSSIASSEQSDFGGIDGSLKATLAVNHVTTTSSNQEQVGRLVIGQIHASSNEPIRLYYHKLPGNSNGAVYFAHETSKSDGGNETWYNLVGNMVNSSGDLSSTSNPSSGIALNEEFSYDITVDGDSLIVTLSQGSTQLAKKTVNMSGSGYDDADNYMYFKAGIYLQDNSSDDDDYAKVTFYELTNTHNNYSH
ncbi:polysaccharide lyase family 7 protein [Vibrio methylphosphonaticus]|uniref:polysaccharide lyase family 7 protein n=1 Tax=Vibrio methylphosphonaticus TaxID=2946866 RepID=UPI00202A653B|nr:polysaccharide lyase family 7 protein [Vibrio methylphosphonaticus]MCL9774573.1 polysaccharide lyase family 7 protein [Vibrio methylphosphonaticus]